MADKQPPVIAKVVLGWVSNECWYARARVSAAMRCQKPGWFAREDERKVYSSLALETSRAHVGRCRRSADVRNKLLLRHDGYLTMYTQPAFSMAHTTLASDFKAPTHPQLLNHFIKPHHFYFVMECRRFFLLSPRNHCKATTLLPKYSRSYLSIYRIS